MIDVKFGVVRTDSGVVDINSRNSSDTKRTFKGVYPAKLGLIINEARKHTYWHVNQQRVHEIINSQIGLRTKVREISRDSTSDKIIFKEHFFESDLSI